jgi:hypothetical protein
MSMAWTRDGGVEMPKRQVRKRSNKNERLRNASAVAVSVSVDDEYLDRFDDVVARCKKAGLKVDQRLDAIGILTGTIDSERLDALRRLAGVASVEGERHISIAPPESDIQ